MTHIRRALEPLRKSAPKGNSHAGLWLDTFVSGKNSEEFKPWIEKATQFDLAEGYETWANRWLKFLEEASDVEVFDLETHKNRIICGLGGSTSWQNNIGLHRTWGVPYIPGSSLKGLAASFAANELDDKEWERESKASDGEKGKHQKTIFGTTEQIGGVAFLDALWFPREGRNELGLHMDTITVHHQEYYNQGKEVPADFDSPVPVPFLSVSGRFIFAIRGGTKQHRKAAREILELALNQEGVGAKTSSGYGRMTMVQRLSEEEQRIKDSEEKAAKFSFPRTKGEISTINSFLQSLHEACKNEGEFETLLRQLKTRLDEEDKERKKVFLSAIVGLIKSDEPTSKSLEAVFPEIEMQSQGAGEDNPWDPKKVAEGAPQPYSELSLREYIAGLIQENGKPKGKSGKPIADGLARAYSKKDGKLAKKLAEKMLK